MKIDIETYKNAYADDMEKLIEEYGNPSMVPSDDQRLASERLRAAYCIDINPDLPVSQIFKIYSIDSRVWHHFVDDTAEMKIERRMSRAEKVAATMRWAEANVGSQVTLEQLMETSGIAYSMAKKITEDRPDVFRKIKRGVFEVRDPKADREADRIAAAKAEAESTENSPAGN